MTSTIESSTDSEIDSGYMTTQSITTVSDAQSAKEHKVTTEPIKEFEKRMLPLNDSFYSGYTFSG